MRILVVAADYPWPETGGARIRLANTLAALTKCAEVHLLSIVPLTRDDSDFAAPPKEVLLPRVIRCKVDTRAPGPNEVFRAALGRRSPALLPLRPGPAVRKAMSDLESTSFDLIWYFTVRAWVWAGQPRLPSTIVDIDDLDDQKILARIATSKSPSTSRAASLRQALTSHFWRFEARRWQSLHRRIDETSVPIVCSEIDATRR